jgi:hypothetical protein
MYYSYIEIEYIATSFSPARTNLALKLLTPAQLQQKTWSTPTDDNAPAPHVVPLHKHVVPIINNDNKRDKFDNIANQTAYVNVIHDNDIYNSNLFCFAVFADKPTGTMYNDLTGSFPYMSLEGNICFLVVYHYEMNTILALPISGFSDETIFAAYKQQYELLESKGFKIRLNVMDNQAS